VQDNTLIDIIITLESAKEKRLFTWTIVQGKVTFLVLKTMLILSQRVGEETKGKVMAISKKY